MSPTCFMPILISCFVCMRLSAPPRGRSIPLLINSLSKFSHHFGALPLTNSASSAPAISITSSPGRQRAPIRSHKARARSQKVYIRGICIVSSFPSSANCVSFLDVMLLRTPTRADTGWPCTEMISCLCSPYLDGRSGFYSSPFASYAAPILFL